MTPKKIYNFPVDHFYFDKQSGRYKWINPLTGKPKWMGRDKDKAIEKAELFNQAVQLKLDEIEAEQQGLPSFSYVIDMYIINVVPHKPWADSTAKNNLASLRMYKREIGNEGQLFSSVDRIGIGKYLENKNYRKADTFNGHRDNLIDVWKYAISKGFCNFNEAGAVMERSTSQKIKSNRKDRLPLTLAEFWTIHDAADQWLKHAMEFSLISLQGRSEICNLHDKQYRDGRFFIIRQKTHAATDLAFLSIKSDELDRLRKAMRSDGLACPYWCRRRPNSQRPQHLQNKPHPFYVNPEYLSKAFRKAANDSGLEWDGKAPSFHEIRGLGGREYLARGFSKDYINALMGHVDDKTTDIYLNNPHLMNDSRYQQVEAGLTLEILKQ